MENEAQYVNEAHYTATVNFLKELGFVPANTMPDCHIFNKDDKGGLVLQAYIFQNLIGDSGVDLEGGWKGPIVNADPYHDDPELIKEQFMSYLDQRFPGWK